MLCKTINDTLSLRVCVCVRVCMCVHARASHMLLSSDLSAFCNGNRLYTPNSSVSVCMCVRACVLLFSIVDTGLVKHAHSTLAQPRDFLFT